MQPFNANYFDLKLSIYLVCNKLDLIIPKTKYIRYTFSTNHNIHKSLYGLCIWASDPLIEIFY